MAQSCKSTNYQPDFRMCGELSGKPSAFVEKWLRKFEYDMHGFKDAEGNIWPSDYLSSIEIFFQTKQKSG